MLSIIGGINFVCALVNLLKLSVLVTPMMADDIIQITWLLYKALC